MEFSIIKKDPLTGARLGKLITPHGEVDTPVFMPVGTQGTVKAMLPEMLKEAGVKVLLGNTYHLYLRPGHQLIRTLGGLHRFMQWPAPILTDSGGYQVFSLSNLRRVTPEGVLFRSHIDGSKHFISPQLAVEIQETLGSDIMMCLDECLPYPATFQAAEKSLTITTSWARACRAAQTNDEQALFGIVQGGFHPILRQRALEELQEIGFDGYALGGFSVGEPQHVMFDLLRELAPSLPENKPHYLMGVGTAEDIVYCVGQGIDMFDCVMPTRSARHGLLFTNEKKVVIRNARYRTDERPIDQSCDCYTCRNYSRAYVRHLFTAGEILAMILCTVHNMRYYMRLMEDIRSAVAAGNYDAFSKDFLMRRRNDEEIGNDGAARK